LTDEENKITVNHVALLTHYCVWKLLQIVTFR